MWWMPSSFIASCHYRRVQDGSLIPRFGRARRDPGLAVLEGFHPLKHALRFDAELLEVVTRDAGELRRLAASARPRRLPPTSTGLAREIDPAVFEQLAPMTPSTGVIGLARRPSVDPAAVLAALGGAPLILLEDPRDLGNMGACVRVAAAADVAGVLSTGSHDPWHPDALRGGAGLHFALPVARLARLEELDGGRPSAARARPRPGEPLEPAALDPRAVLAFGTERHGLSVELLSRSDARISIPMRAGCRA